MARSKTFPRDVRERAVALVFEQVKTGQYGSQWVRGSITLPLPLTSDDW